MVLAPALGFRLERRRLLDLGAHRRFRVGLVVMLWRRRADVPADPEAEFRARWAQKQALAAPARYYGDGGTIHSGGHLDVETRDGKVVAVWFRCTMLAFTQIEVGEQRAADMGSVRHTPALTGVEILDA